MLEKKHKDDFFMCEVKTGPSWGNSDLGIIDAIAMRRSWSKPKITGYEIKVSRIDFVKDEKWQKYLNYCNEFYFACPTDLISLEELPDGVGLIYVREKTNRIIRKAVYQEKDIPAELFIYMIMSRLENDRYPFHSSRKEYFEDFLNYKYSNKVIGDKVAQRIFDLNETVSRYKSNSETLDEIRKIFDDNNIRTFGNYELKTKIKKLIESGGIIPSNIESALRNINWAKEELNKAEKNLGKRNERK